MTTVGNKDKFIPLLFAILICATAYLIPESKATTFLQFSTPVGTISPDKIIVVFLLFLSLCLILIKKRGILRSNQLIEIYLYITWLTIVAMISLLTYGFFQLNSFIFRMIMNFGTFFIAYYLCSSYKRFVPYFKRFVILFGFVNSILCIFQHYTNYPLLIGKYVTVDRGFWVNGVSTVRVWGFQGEPLAAGTVTMVSILFLIGSYKSFVRRNAIRLILFYDMVVIMTMGIIFTFSRGSLIALVVGILFLAIKSKIRLTPKRLILLSLIIISALIVSKNSTLNNLIFSRFSSLSNGDASFTHRWSVIQSISTMVDQLGLPSLLGLGTGSGLSIRNFIGVIDNGFLGIFFEDGLVGIGLFLMITLSLLRHKCDTTIQAALFAILCNMVTYEMTYYSTIGCLLWAIIGTLSAEKALFKKDKVVIIGEKEQLNDKRHGVSIVE